MYIHICIYIYIYIHIYDNQIVHHNPCFNLFILHKKLFANQGSEINKNIYIYIYIYIIRNINTKFKRNIHTKDQRFKQKL